VPELIDEYQRMAAHVRPAPVVAVAAKTNRLSDVGARRAIDELHVDTGLPVDDPVRHGAGTLLDAVLAAQSR
jgi:uncharacterized NAD-dependent epimerase/dehydratase family protein